MLAEFTLQTNTGDQKKKDAQALAYAVQACQWLPPERPLAMLRLVFRVGPGSPGNHIDIRHCYEVASERKHMQLASLPLWSGELSSAPKPWMFRQAIEAAHLTPDTPLLEFVKPENLPCVFIDDRFVYKLFDYRQRIPDVQLQARRMASPNIKHIPEATILVEARDMCLLRYRV